MASLSTTQPPIRIIEGWNYPRLLFIRLTIPVALEASPLCRLLAACSLMWVGLGAPYHRLIRRPQAKIGQAAPRVHTYLPSPTPYPKSALSSHQAYPHTSTGTSPAWPPYSPTSPVSQPR